MKVFIVLAAVAAFASAQNFKCPAKDGQYEDDKQCDKFYECVDGVATVKLCPDGLVFDPTIRKINKCDQPFNVDCGDRTELQLYSMLKSGLEYDYKHSKYDPNGKWSGGGVLEYDP